MVITALINLLHDALLDPTGGKWRTAAFFLVSGIFSFSLVPFLDHLLLMCALMVISAVSFLAALGTHFEWPGFRLPREPHECHRCRYDLTDNVSGVCPECGTPVDADVET